MNYNFEWDVNKANSNLLKHKIGFEDAISVFKDKLAMSIYGKKDSLSEDRWITMGIDSSLRILIVVHTFITLNEDNCNIRIISARKATKQEQKTYKEA